MDEATRTARDKLMAANRILVALGVLDAYGHVSMRSPADPGRFLLARDLAPGLVTAADILEFGMNGEPVVPYAGTLYSERYIHAAVLAARPDVDAVIHSHSDAVLPYGISAKVKLRAVLHTCGFLGCGGAPVFEMREVDGDATNLMVRDMRAGTALARKLGEENVVLMRGHGMTVTGRSIEIAVFHASHVLTNARAQQVAMQFGDVTYLSPGEVAATERIRNVARAWNFWCDRYVPRCADTTVV